MQLPREMLWGALDDYGLRPCVEPTAKYKGPSHHLFSDVFFLGFFLVLVTLWSYISATFLGAEVTVHSARARRTLFLSS